MSSFNFKVIWIIGISFLFNSVIALLSFAVIFHFFDAMVSIPFMIDVNRL